MSNGSINIIERVQAQLGEPRGVTGYRNASPKARDDNGFTSSPPPPPIAAAARFNAQLL